MIHHCRVFNIRIKSTVTHPPFLYDTLHRYSRHLDSKCLWRRETRIPQENLYTKLDCKTYKSATVAVSAVIMIRPQNT